MATGAVMALLRMVEICYSKTSRSGADLSSRFGRRYRPREEEFAEKLLPSEGSPPERA